MEAAEPVFPGVLYRVCLEKTRKTSRSLLRKSKKQSCCSAKLVVVVVKISLSGNFHDKESRNHGYRQDRILDYSYSCQLESRYIRSTEYGVHLSLNPGGDPGGYTSRLDVPFSQLTRVIQTIA